MGEKIPNENLLLCHLTEPEQQLAHGFNLLDDPGDTNQSSYHIFSVYMFLKILKNG